MDSDKKTHVTSLGPEHSMDLDPPPFIPAWLRGRLAQLKGAPVSVFLAYVSHADRCGLAYPSVRTLCRVTGYGTQSVKKARKVLVQDHLLLPRRQERRGGKFGRKIFQLPWKKGEI